MVIFCLYKKDINYCIINCYFVKCFSLYFKNLYLSTIVDNYCGYNNGIVLNTYNDN